MMERRMTGNCHVRCGVGENSEIISKSYLSLFLVLKYLENEVIRNRDYNLKNGTDRKIIVVVDECHLFIDEKYPIALDFMYQMAKRIRKYNGMEIVITQSICAIMPRIPSRTVCEVKL